MYSYRRFDSAGEGDACDQPGKVALRHSVSDEAGSYKPSDNHPDRPSHDDIQAIGARLRQHARQLSMQTALFIDDLALFDEHRGWRYEGARSCAQWLSWRCSLGKVAASEQVRVARALKKLPLIRELFLKGDLSFSKVRAITRIATEANEDELVDLAITHAAHDLEDAVRRYRDARSADAVCDENQRATWQFEHRHLNYHWRHDGCLQINSRLPPEQGALFLKALEIAEQAIGFERYDVSGEASGEAGPEDIPTRTPSQRRADALCLIVDNHLSFDSQGRAGDRHQVVVNVDLDVLQEQFDMAAPPSTECSCCSDTTPAARCQLEPGPAIGAETARRLSCDANLVHILSREGEPLAIGRKSALVTSAMRRALLFRDEHRCQFPGCSGTHGLQAHHVIHWAHGGNTDLDNLVSLCPFHHRLLHEGGYRIERNTDWEKPSMPAALVRSIVQAESYEDLLRQELVAARTGSSSGSIDEDVVDERIYRGKSSTLFGKPRRRPAFLFFDRNGLAVGSVDTVSDWDMRMRQ